MQDKSNINQFNQNQGNLINNNINQMGYNKNYNKYMQGQYNMQHDQYHQANIKFNQQNIQKPMGNKQKMHTGVQKSSLGGLQFGPEAHNQNIQNQHITSPDLLSKNTSDHLEDREIRKPLILCF